MNKTTIIVIFALTCSILASFIYISLQDRIKTSELVIIGVLDSINYKAIDITSDKERFPGTYLDIGFIKIRKILHNKLADLDTTMKIPIVMSSVKDKWVSSGDISYEKGRDGIWILNKEDKIKLFTEYYLDNLKNNDSLYRILNTRKIELFSASYPKDFQKIDLLDSILKIIDSLDVSNKK